MRAFTARAEAIACEKARGGVREAGGGLRGMPECRAAADYPGRPSAATHFGAEVPRGGQSCVN